MFLFQRDRKLFYFKLSDDVKSKKHQPYFFIYTIDVCWLILMIDTSYYKSICDQHVLMNNFDERLRGMFD